MNLRIQLCPFTVKALQRRLQCAYSTGDKRLIRRTRYCSKPCRSVNP